MGRCAEGEFGNGLIDVILVADQVFQGVEEVT